MAKVPRKFTVINVPDLDDKGQTPNVTSGDDNDTGITISNTPTGNVNVLVDGTQRTVGNGVDTKDSYFGDASAISDFTKIAAGERNSGGLRSGSAWMWGMGTYGNLGDETTVGKSSPVSVVGGHSFVEMVVAGDASQCIIARKADGTAWTWGNDGSGRLGDGGPIDTAGDRSSPVSVLGNHSFIQVAAGERTNHALKADGSAWSWGYNSDGQLGNNTDGTATNRSSPVSVVGGHSFIELAHHSHDAFMAALKADGSAWMWGDNASGQLGDNSRSDRSSPVSVIGGHSFVDISCGQTWTLARKADGTAWSWGESSVDRLGSAPTDRSSPVSVYGNHSFTQIDAGSAHTLALKEDGTLWVWGYGDSGRLGLNDTNNRTSPTSVVGEHSFVEIRAGDGHSMARKVDGSVWAWGRQDTSTSYGVVGDNTNNDRSSPTSVLGTGGVPSPRSIANIVAGDSLYWNGTTAGFDLTAESVVDIDYDTQG
jgi:alpha-tubulin suppressor-like RCC1 family protein